MLKVFFPPLSLLFMGGFVKRGWPLSVITMFCAALLCLWSYPPFFSASYSDGVSVDSLGASLGCLVFWVSALMVMASQKIVLNKTHSASFLVVCTLLSLTLFSAFVVNNFLFFYLLFEASLVPTLGLVLLWGAQPERVQAAMYLAMYTTMASLPLLVFLSMVGVMWGSLFMGFSYSGPPGIGVSSAGAWVLANMAFLVKIPVYFVHLWLPKAHVEAPVAGSMVLAAVLLKLGCYGALRMGAMFQNMSAPVCNWGVAISLFGAVYASVICLRQTDLKALIAYSSVSHMGLLVAAMMLPTQWAWNGALVVMVAHGLVSSGLFVACNAMYEVSHSRSLVLNKGLLALCPCFGGLFFYLCVCNMAGPGISLFGELSLMSTPLFMSWVFSVVVLVNILLVGAYTLHVYTSTSHGGVPTYTHPANYAGCRVFFVVFLHLFPAVALVLKMEFLTPWA